MGDGDASDASALVWGGWDYRRPLTARWFPQDPLKGLKVATSYRTLVALYYVGVLCTDWPTNPQPSTYLAYLTIQTMLMTLSYFACSATLGWRVLCASRLRAASLKRHAKVTQVLFTMATSLELMVLCLYWSLLYDPSKPEVGRFGWIDVSVHGMTSCTLVTDLLAVGSNRPLDKHVLYVLVYAVCYLALNYGVSTSMGVPLYPVLTWKDAGSFVLCAGGLVGGVGAYFTASTLAWFRDRLAEGRIGNCPCGRHRRIPARLASVSGSRKSVKTGFTADFNVDASEGHYASLLNHALDRSSMNLRLEDGAASGLLLFPGVFADESRAFPLSSLRCCRRRCGRRCGTEATLAEEEDAEGSGGSGIGGAGGLLLTPASGGGKADPHAPAAAAPSTFHVLLSTEGDL